ncbi:hypothetical protein ACLOJK_035587 [Asimina triloba]
MSFLAASRISVRNLCWVRMTRCFRSQCCRSDDRLDFKEVPDLRNRGDPAWPIWVAAHCCVAGSPCYDDSNVELLLWPSNKVGLLAADSISAAR